MLISARPDHDCKFWPMGTKTLFRHSPEKTRRLPVKAPVHAYPLLPSLSFYSFFVLNNAR